MSIINSFFNKIYVVSMEKNTERHQYINELFRKYNIANYKILHGPEGESINVSELYNKKLIQEHMKKMPNPIGTIETHKMAWQDFVNSGCEKCLVFEDDVYFLENFESRLSQFLTNLPDNWDVLQIGWLPPHYSNKEDKKINEYVKLRWSGVAGAHCYALKINSARILIENVYPINKAVDGYIGDITNPWTKLEKNIHLDCYSPLQCLAIDCSHDHGNTIKFESHGIA